MAGAKRNNHKAVKKGWFIMKKDKTNCFNIDYDDVNQICFIVQFDGGDFEFSSFSDAVHGAYLIRRLAKPKEIRIEITITECLEWDPDLHQGKFIRHVISNIFFYKE